jgi:hypothetical protein
VLDRLHREDAIRVLIHGGARGADLMAARWASDRGVTAAECKAQWHRYGQRAGPIRNADMLSLQPDLVVAFRGGNGTAHMCSIAAAAGVKVWHADTAPSRKDDEQPTAPAGPADSAGSPATKPPGSR